MIGRNIGDRIIGSNEHHLLNRSSGRDRGGNSATEASPHHGDPLMPTLDVVIYRLGVGNALMRAKDYEGARTAYLQALGFAPSDKDVHVSLANVYEQMNRHAAQPE